MAATPGDPFDGPSVDGPSINPRRIDPNDPKPPIFGGNADLMSGIYDLPPPSIVAAPQLPQHLDPLLTNIGTVHQDKHIKELEALLEQKDEVINSFKCAMDVLKDDNTRLRQLCTANDAKTEEAKIDVLMAKQEAKEEAEEEMTSEDLLNKIRARAKVTDAANAAKNRVGDRVGNSTRHLAAGYHG